MNLNKYTKAELISKLKRLDAKNSSNSTTQIKLVELLTLLKSWVMKLTIITLIFKYFKKYTFITKMLRFFNWIILTIFGFSVVDNFNLSYMPSFITDIRLIVAGITAYLTSTQFYAYLGGLWGLKVTKEPEISRRTWSSSTVYPKSEWNESKISESKPSFIDSLSAKFDQMKKSVSGSDDEDDPTQNFWNDDDGEQTPVDKKKERSHNISIDFNDPTHENQTQDQIIIICILAY